MPLYAHGIVLLFQVILGFLLRPIPVIWERMTDGFGSVECLQGNGLDKSFAFAISQMVLDIFGDLLSKFHMV